MTRETIEARLQSLDAEAQRARDAARHHLALAREAQDVGQRIEGARLALGELLAEFGGTSGSRDPEVPVAPADAVASGG